MQEYGVFNDEGCIEADFWTEESAEEAAAQYRAEGDEYAKASAICPEHEQQPRDTCEACAEEDEECEECGDLVSECACVEEEQ